MPKHVSFIYSLIYYPKIFSPPVTYKPKSKANVKSQKLQINQKQTKPKNLIVKARKQRNIRRGNNRTRTRKQMKRKKKKKQLGLFVCLFFSSSSSSSSLFLNTGQFSFSSKNIWYVLECPVQPEIDQYWPPCFQHSTF